MTGLTEAFILIGAILLAGLAVDFLGRKTSLPRVTLLLLFGFMIGPSGLDIFTHAYAKWFPLFTDMALLLVGFLLGGRLTLHGFRQHGRFVITISLVESSLTAIAVLSGLLLLGAPPELALLLAGIATATAPAATLDVVHELKARGELTRTVLGVVAIDDAWGLIIFSLMLTAAGFVTASGNAVEPLLDGAWEIVGALMIGIVIGIPAAFLTGRIQPGEPTLVEAIGVIFLCGGISLALGVSLLLAIMATGATIANLARHHIRPFHEIEHIEWPFMIMFFVLAGASLHLEILLQIGAVGVAYILLRAAGKMTGAWIGATLCRAPEPLRRWTGMALMPQAGVALGMALIAHQRFPESGAMVLSIAIGAVVLFELFGPIATRFALIRAGEVKEHFRIRSRK